MSLYHRLRVEDYKEQADSENIWFFGERVTIDGIRKYIEKEVLPRDVICEDIEIDGIKTQYKLCKSRKTSLLAVEGYTPNQEEAFYWNLINYWNAVDQAEDKLFSEREELFNKKTKIYGLIQKLSRIGDKELLHKLVMEVGYTDKSLDEINKRIRKVIEKKKNLYAISICSDWKEGGESIVKKAYKIDKETYEEKCKGDVNSEYCEELKLRLDAYQLALEKCNPKDDYYNIFAKFIRD